MTDLIACLSSGEKGRAHVSRLIEEKDWGNVYLITNEIGKNNFKSGKNVKFVLVDFQKPVSLLIEDKSNGFRGCIKPSFRQRQRAYGDPFCIIKIRRWHKADCGHKGRRYRAVNRFQAYLSSI